MNLSQKKHKDPAVARKDVLHPAYTVFVAVLTFKVIQGGRFLSYLKSVHATFC